MTDKELFSEAIKAMESSYSPYSECSVGAALLTKSGKIYYGANIENAAFSPTVCAERVAFFKAISEGERDFTKIAVVGGKNKIIKDIFAPCGVCRQVMSEFCNKNFTVILGTSENDLKITSLGELLPLSFSAEDLK